MCYVGWKALHPGKETAHLIAPKSDCLSRLSEFVLGRTFPGPGFDRVIKGDWEDSLTL